MIELNDSVVFVKGAKNGAIYDFRTEKVFSVNAQACSIIERYISNESSAADLSYLNLLRKNQLIDSQFSPKPFLPQCDDSIDLNMAWLEITQSCNLHCLHCYEGVVHSVTNDSLRLEDWFDVIDQLASLDINRLIIIGGEPCCHPDICAIIDYASLFNFNITLFTNGTLFNETLLRTVVENAIRVKVSVYGHCSEIHDLITGVPGSFDKLFSSVEYLIEHGIEVSAAVIIMKENENHSEDILRFVRNKGLLCSRYDVIRKVYGGLQDPHIPTEKKVLDSVYFTKPNFKADKKYFLKYLNRNTCWYGKITIKYNGDVIPCEFEREFLYGNVKTNKIKDIISNEATRFHWFFDFGKVDECKDCEFRFVCHDCRPLGKSLNGCLTTKNPRCLYNVYDGVWGQILE